MKNEKRKMKNEKQNIKRKRKNKKRKMKNEKWKMKNKKQKSKNEKRKIKNKKWKTKNEKWKMKNEKWKTKNEKWKMKNQKRNARRKNPKKSDPALAKNYIKQKSISFTVCTDRLAVASGVHARNNSDVPSSIPVTGFWLGDTDVPKTVVALFFFYRGCPMTPWSLS